MASFSARASEATPTKGFALCAASSSRLDTLVGILRRALPAARLELAGSVAAAGGVCSGLLVSAGDGTSANLDRLARLSAKDATPGVRLHLLDRGVELPSLVSALDGGKVVLKPCAEYFKFPCTLGDDDMVLADGFTLVPAKEPLHDQDFYSVTEYVEIYVGEHALELETGKTVFHELVHADIFRQTGSSEYSGHVGPNSREVNRACRDAEAETDLRWQP